jgi:hypothetical protein
MDTQVTRRPCDREVRRKRAWADGTAARRRRDGTGVAGCGRARQTRSGGGSEDGRSVATRTRMRTRDGNAGAGSTQRGRANGHNGDAVRGSTACGKRGGWGRDVDEDGKDGEDGVRWAAPMDAVNKDKGEVTASGYGVGRRRWDRTRGGTCAREGRGEHRRHGCGGQRRQLLPQRRGRRAPWGVLAHTRYARRKRAAERKQHGVWRHADVVEGGEATWMRR